MTHETTMTDTTTNPTEQIRTEWTLGSYPVLAQTFLPLAARLVDAADVRRDDRLLDVACGTGNAALTASRRGATVTGIDITPAMLEQAREQADVIDADVTWQEADATDLPFPADAFDVTLSCLGHMFAEDPTAAGAELLRVTRPGGTVAFTAWTPGSAIDEMLTALVATLPPRPDAPPSPHLWGDPTVVADRFDGRVSDLDFEHGTLAYPALSPAHFWHTMTVVAGPVVAALETVAEADRPGLDEAVVEAVEPFFDGQRNAVDLAHCTVTATVG